MISNWPGAIPLARSKTSQQLSYLAASQALRIFLVIHKVQTIRHGCENKNHSWLGSLILMTRYTSERCFTYSMTLYAIENKKCRYKINCSGPYKNENHLIFDLIISISLEKRKTINSPSMLYLNNSFYNGATVSKLVMIISLKNCYGI